MSTLCRQNAVTPKTLGNFLSCNACQIGHGGGTNMNPLVNDLVQKKTICCVTTHQLSFKQGTKCVQSTSPAPRLFSTFATLGNWQSLDFGDLKGKPWQSSCRNPPSQASPRARLGGAWGSYLAGGSHPRWERGSPRICKVGTVLPCSKSKPTVNKSKPSCAVCGNRAGALRAILLGCGDPYRER
eukprot:1136893-Pelagomonas_calceolata.AAC.7